MSGCASLSATAAGGSAGADCGLTTCWVCNTAASAWALLPAAAACRLAAEVSSSARSAGSTCAAHRQQRSRSDRHWRHMRTVEHALACQPPQRVCHTHAVLLTARPSSLSSAGVQAASRTASLYQQELLLPPLLPHAAAAAPPAAGVPAVHAARCLLQLAAVKGLLSTHRSSREGSWRSTVYTHQHSTARLAVRAQVDMWHELATATTGEHVCGQLH
jgi:hypothetical protein